MEVGFDQEYSIIAFMTYKIYAIILGSNEVKEYDRFYNILTNDHGKKTVIAKGVRKVTAKLASGLEPITYSEIFLAKGRSFDRVTGVIIHDQFNEIKKDLAKIKGTRKFFRIIDWLLMEKSLDPEENKELFEGLVFYLKLMDEKETDNLKSQVVKMAIIWKIIHLLGFQPQIFNCAHCSEKLQEKDFYQMILPSGIVCDNCLKNLRVVSHRQKISKDVLKVLRIYSEKQIKTSSKIKITLKQCNELRRLTVVAIGHILGRRVDL